MVTAGNITAGIGSILFGLAPTFSGACAGRVLVGLGVSVIFISIMKSNSLWFSARWFALMAGATSFIGNTGSVLSAGPLAMALTVFSWRSMFIGIGVFSLLLAISGFLVIRNRPEDAGFPPVGGNAEFQSPRDARHWLADLWSVASVWHIWPGFWVNFGVNGGLYAFMGLWGMPYLRDVYGLSRGEAAGYMTVMLLATTFGVLFSGWIADHFGVRKPLLFTSACLSLCSWLALFFLPWKPGIEGYLLFAFAGFAATGAIVTLANAKEVSDPALAGTATSLVNTGTFLAVLILQPLIGWMLDLGWTGAISGGARIYSASDYHHAFLLIPACTVIGIIAATRVRETSGGAGNGGEILNVMERRTSHVNP
jgi:predicted MFS family arabinose efflux permease